MIRSDWWIYTKTYGEDKDTASVTDADVRELIRKLTGLECHEIKLYPEGKTRNLLRRLVREDGIRIAQLSRLTGITRGEIRRFVL